MTETRVLTSFESSSVRCLTRQEESLLQAAVAMTIVKKRFQGRNKKPRHCRVEALFSLPPPTKLLPRPLPDHMDHMVQVACRLEGRTLEGVASHLVQQLDAWILQLQVVVGRQERREKYPDAATTTITTGIRPLLNKTTGTDDLTRHDGTSLSSTQEANLLLAPIHDWMAKSLLSFSPQGSSSTMVFHAIILQSDKNHLLDSWWHVLATLIHQIDQGNLPQRPACSLDCFAVLLLELLQTLATRTSMRRQHDDPATTITIPALLQELLFPLPTPTNLSDLLWNFADNVPAARRKASSTSLSPGAKLLLRLGLCRILLFQPETRGFSPRPHSFPRMTHKGLTFPGQSN